MELELKHLAPYLPYGLEILEITKGNFECDPNNEDKELLTDRNVSRFIGKKPYRCLSQKPILRPLSNLTLDVINKFYVNKAENGIILRKYITPKTMEITLTATYKMMGDSFTDFIISQNSIINTDYWLVELLLKHHYDVFGLIEKGLAIDINTL